MVSRRWVFRRRVGRYPTNYCHLVVSTSKAGAATPAPSGLGSGWYWTCRHVTLWSEPLRACWRACHSSTITLFPMSLVPRWGSVNLAAALISYRMRRRLVSKKLQTVQAITRTNTGRDKIFCPPPRHALQLPGELPIHSRAWGVDTILSEAIQLARKATSSSEGRSRTCRFQV